MEIKNIVTIAISTTSTAILVIVGANLTLLLNLIEQTLPIFIMFIIANIIQWIATIQGLRTKKEKRVDKRNVW